MASLATASAIVASSSSSSSSSNGGVLRSGGCGAVWVTHAVHFLPRPEVSRILVLDASGGVQFYGTWKELLERTSDVVIATATAPARDQPPAAAASLLSSSSSSSQLVELVASAVAPVEDEESGGRSATSARSVAVAAYDAVVQQHEQGERLLPRRRGRRPDRDG